MGANDPSDAGKTDDNIGNKVADKSLKSITLGQIGDALDYLKKFWLAIVGVLMALYAALTYFATADSLRQLACESEKRASSEATRATVLVLSSEKTSLAHEQTSLLNLRVLLLETEKSNRQQLNLSTLNAELVRLIDISKANESQKDGQLAELQKDLESARQEFNRCKEL